MIIKFTGVTPLQVQQLHELVDSDDFSFAKHCRGMTPQNQAPTYGRILDCKYDGQHHSFTVEIRFNDTIEVAHSWPRGNASDRRRLVTPLSVIRRIFDVLGILPDLEEPQLVSPEQWIADRKSHKAFVVCAGDSHAGYTQEIYLNRGHRWSPNREDAKDFLTREAALEAALEAVLFDKNVVYKSGPVVIPAE